MAIITGNDGGNSVSGTDYTDSTGLTEGEITQALVKADAYDPNRISSAEDDINDLERDVNGLQSDLNEIETALGNSVIKNSMIVPLGSWWRVATITLGEFNISINSQASSGNSSGLAVVNNGSKRFYLTTESYFGEDVGSSSSTATTRFSRLSPSPNDTVGVGTENNMHAGNYIKYRLICSSYGSSDPLSDILQIDVTVSRHDSSNRLFIVRGELLNR